MNEKSLNQPDLIEICENGNYIGKHGPNDVFRYGSAVYFVNRSNGAVKECPLNLIETIFKEAK